MKIYQSFFFPENVQFLEVKVTIYLNRLVFVMSIRTELGIIGKKYHAIKYPIRYCSMIC